MSREIKYRGRRLDNGEWAYGFPCRIQEDDSTYSWIMREDTTRHIANVTKVIHRVDPDTIGQYTGQTDAHRASLYEGDIFEDDAVWYQIVWSEYSGGWDCQEIHGTDSMALSEFANCSTTFKQGDIYTTPELLTPSTN